MKVWTDIFVTVTIELLAVYDEWMFLRNSRSFRDSLAPGKTWTPHPSESCREIDTQIARFMGPTRGQSGSCRPQGAPCCPHEPCYQGSFIYSCVDILIIIASSYIQALRQTDWQMNRPISQIPKCTYSISHNTPFKTEMCTFLLWIAYNGIWDRFILGLDRLKNASICPHSYIYGQPVFSLGTLSI